MKKQNSEHGSVHYHLIRLRQFCYLLQPASDFHSPQFVIANPRAIR